jgi:hypothetical protein
VPTKAHYATCGVWPPLRVARGSYCKYSKRDYESFAKSIRGAREKLATDDIGANVTIDLAINEIIWGLCELFKKDNPEFEELRFIGACSSTV